MLTGILNIGSNDITETNCANVNAEDLFQQTDNIAKKCRLFRVNNIGISSILVMNKESHWL